MTNSPAETGGTRGEHDPTKRRENRQHLRIMEEIVYQGWNVPADAMQMLPREVLAIAADPNASPRDRIRATELLNTLRQSTFDAACDLDRIYRLEEGKATDRVELNLDLPDSALEAVARSIVNLDPAPAKPCRKRKKA